MPTPRLVQPQQTDVILGSMLRQVLPQDLAGLDGQREHVVGAGDDVDDAVVDDRLRFARILRRDAGAVQMGAPNSLELRHVAAVDQRQRRVALVVEVAAVRAPTVTRRCRQRARRECAVPLRDAVARHGNAERKRGQRSPSVRPPHARARPRLNCHSASYLSVPQPRGRQQYTVRLLDTRRADRLEKTAIENNNKSLDLGGESLMSTIVAAPLRACTTLGC